MMRDAVREFEPAPIPTYSGMVARRLRTNWVLWASSLIVAGLIGVAFAAPWVAPFPPLQPDVPNRLQPPSWRHWFGTDALGRDVFSRVLYGSRISLGIVFLILGMAVPVGTALGAAAGYQGGRFDALMARVTDMFFAFPALVLAMAINAALGPSIVNTTIAVAAVWWPSYMRLMRGQVLAVRQQPYVEAARALGAGHWRILARHILPNAAPPLVAKVTTDMGHVLLTAAGLSFIGLGVQPPTPEWGAMIADGRTYMLDYWWYATFPGLAIAVTVVAFAFLGDSLQEALDPSFNRRVG
jgi:peptide/nickel transport system permease protein